MNAEANKAENLTANHIVGVIDDAAAAAKVAEELVAAGYEPPAVLTGEEGARQLDTKGDGSNVFARLIDKVQDHLSEATNYIKQYADEARSGHNVVAVAAKDRDLAERAKQILDRNGAHNVRFFGVLAVADLTPETNPTARAEESPENVPPSVMNK